MSVSTSTSADFHQVFNTAKAEIDELLKAGAAPTSIAPRITSLRQEYTAVQGSLPGYDQRKYEGLLGELEGSLAALRAKDKPRTKFAFAKKPAAAAKAASSSTTPQAGPQGASNSNTAEEAASSTAVSRPDNSHTVSNLTNERITLASLPNPTGEYTLSLASLSSCLIDLRSSGSSEGILKSIHVKGLTRCILLTDLLGGSALLHDLTDCLVVLGAHQFRMHTSTRSTVLLHVPSVPVIEHCKDLLFGSYPAETASATLSTDNKVDQLADFDWVRGGPSPNWRRLSAEEESSITASVGSVGSDGSEVESTLSSVLGSISPLYTSLFTTHA